MWNHVSLVLFFRAKQILSGYTDIYKTKFMDAFRAKLGLLQEEQEDEYLVAVLLQVSL